MKHKPVEGTAPSPWAELRRFTDARIALGRVGVSLPTSKMLAFDLAHALARDAVHAALDVPQLLTALHALGLRTIEVASKAADRSRSEPMAASSASRACAHH